LNELQLNKLVPLRRRGRGAAPYGSNLQLALALA